MFVGLETKNHVLPCYSCYHHNSKTTLTVYSYVSICAHVCVALSDYSCHLNITNLCVQACGKEKIFKNYYRFKKVFEKKMLHTVYISISK